MRVPKPTSKQLAGLIKIRGIIEEEMQAGLYEDGEGGCDEIAYDEVKYANHYLRCLIESVGRGDSLSENAT